MKKKVFLTIIGLFSLVLMAQAASRQTTIDLNAGGVAILNNVAMDGLASTMTFKTSSSATRGLGVLTLFIRVVDADSSITSVTMSCSALRHGDNTSLYAYQSCSVVSGVCTSNNATWTLNPGTDSYWMWRVDIDGSFDNSCVFAPGGVPAAADKLTVWAYASTK